MPRRLLAYPWPGNIRELENVVHRALLVSQLGVITPADLNLPVWQKPAPPVAPSAAMLPNPGSTGPVVAGTDPGGVGGHGAQGGYANLRQAWQALLNSDHKIAFEHMVLQLAEDAWRHNLCNQVRTAKQLNISRNILRTYLKKADLL
jgi:sigma-54-specific transcriptional regulator